MLLFFAFELLFTFFGSRLLFLLVFLSLLFIVALAFLGFLSLSASAAGAIANSHPELGRSAQTRWNAPPGMM
jgi:hypothetical protein